VGIETLSELDETARFFTASGDPYMCPTLRLFTPSLEKKDTEDSFRDEFLNEE
jgi:hypothetical protein